MIKVFLSSVIAISLILLSAFNCSKNDPNNIADHAETIKLNKSSSVDVFIMNHEMPTYGSYYFNVDPLLNSSATISNYSSTTQNCDVVFKIIDPLDNEYEIDSKNIAIGSNSNVTANLQGNFTDNIVSGWFKSKIELYCDGNLIDSKIKANAFSAFHKAENYTNADIADYAISEHGYSDYSCAPHIFGYETRNVYMHNNNYLRIQIPNPQTQTDWRRGGNAFLDDAYRYGQFKAKIRMNLNTPYSLGAFWLRDLAQRRDAINMEVYQNASGEFIVACEVYYNGTREHRNPVVVSTNPNSNFIEYKIDWEDDHIKFFYNGNCIDSVFNTGIIPSSQMNLAFNYRMTPWSGGLNNCNPTLPGTSTFFDVDWACW